jgi:AraC family transcriptional regulator, transcriptional activator of pobA
VGAGPRPGKGSGFGHDWTIFGTLTARQMGRTTSDGHRAAVPELVHLPASPGSPALRVLRFTPSDPPPLPGRHAHDHLALGYFEQDGGWLRSQGRSWDLSAGDLVVVGPGDIWDATGLAAATGWAAFFAPEALPAGPGRVLLAWRTHPLLSMFAAGGSRGPHVAHMAPGAGRTWWGDRFAELHREVHERATGHREAATALLTLLIVAVARLLDDANEPLTAAHEPLLAEVFAVIEARYAEPLALRDVASQVSLTPGYLTTIVRQRTGRTVQAWIAERRMVEARALLVTTDLSVAEVAGRVGFEDTPYFVRSFRRAHGMTPVSWRRMGRET